MSLIYRKFIGPNKTNKVGDHKQVNDLNGNANDDNNFNGLDNDDDKVVFNEDQPVQPISFFKMVNWFFLNNLKKKLI